MSLKQLFCRHKNLSGGTNVIDNSGAFLFSVSDCDDCGKKVTEKGALILNGPSVRERDL